MDTIRENPKLLKHTPGHKNCPACVGATDMQPTQLSPAMTFPEAFEAWITELSIQDGGVYTNARYLSERTRRDLTQYQRAAAKFFGQLRLDEIEAGHLKAYQQARAVCDHECAHWKKRAGANLIRKEIGTLIRVMKAAGAWTDQHTKAFKPLQTVESDVARAMTPGEQHEWLRAAASRERWRLIYWWSIVALQTTAATNEMRSLRLGDIFLDQGVMQIRTVGAKNKFRIRTIPLATPEVAWAFTGLIERAQRLGSRAPHHCLFPLHMTADRYDPNQPMTAWGLRKPWEAVQLAAGFDSYPLPRDLRHTAITRMAEAGMPIQVIMSFAGHISPRMQQHYTQISMQAKRKWAAAAWMGAEMPFQPALTPGWTMTPPAQSGKQQTPPAVPEWAREAAG